MATWPMQFLIYGAGDAAEMYGSLATPISSQLNALEGVATNRYVNCAVQLDNSGSVPSFRKLLDPLGRHPPELLHEVNTGDPNELINFVRWATSNYRAERCVLVLSGHGVAWQDEKVKQGLRAARGYATKGPLTQPTEHEVPSSLLDEIGDLVVYDAQVADWLTQPSRGGGNGGGFTDRPSPWKYRSGGGNGEGEGAGANILDSMGEGFLGGLSEDGVSVVHPRKLFRPADTRGILIDGTTRDGVEDFLDNSELSRACETAVLHRGGKFAAVVFDACLMSSLEVITEMRGSTATVVAAVDEISSQGLNLRGAASLATARRGVLSARDIAQTFPQAYVPFTPTDSCIAIDIEDERFGAGLRYLKAVSRGLLAWGASNTSGRDSLRRVIQAASASIRRSRGTSVADLNYFQQTLSMLPGLPPPIRDDLAAALTQFQGCVIGKKTGYTYEQAFGISIFAPRSAQDYIFNRPDYIRLQFSSATEWGALLDFLFL